MEGHVHFLTHILTWTYTFTHVRICTHSFLCLHTLHIVCTHTHTHTNRPCGIWNSLSHSVIFFPPYLLGKVFFRNTREERKANSLLWFFRRRLDQTWRTHTRAHTQRHIHTQKLWAPSASMRQKSITRLFKKSLKTNGKRQWGSERGILINPTNTHTYSLSILLTLSADCAFSCLLFSSLFFCQKLDG